MIYRNLKDAVLELDPVLIGTMSGFTFETHAEVHRVRFRFALYGPNLDDAHETESGDIETKTVAQYPDTVVSLALDLDPEEQIRGLEESEILGGFHAVQLPPGIAGNDTEAPKWVVRAHSGSQAEWIAWLGSIG